MLKCSKKTAYETIKKYRQQGILNILENPRSGRKSLLSMEDSKIIKEEVIIQNSQNSQCKVVHIEIVNDLDLNLHHRHDDRKKC